MHFRFPALYFIPDDLTQEVVGVTVVSTQIRDYLTIWDDIMGIYSSYIDYPVGRVATAIRNRLKVKGIHGVAICNYRDQYNKARGRVIAKGRLLKHLRHIAMEGEYDNV